MPSPRADEAAKPPRSAKAAAAARTVPVVGRVVIADLLVLCFTTPLDAGGGDLFWRDKEKIRKGPQDL
jgi:hypothetical protein